jgi:hypothetical protein
MGPTKLDAAHDNDQQTTLGQNNQHFVLDDFEILKTIGELRRHLFICRAPLSHRADLMHWFLMLLWNWITGTGTFGRVCLCQEKIISSRGNGALSDGPSSVNKQTDNKKTTGRYWALKILLLKDVIRLKQVEHVKNEKKILAAISHPFIVRLWVYLVFSTLSLSLAGGRTLGSAPKRRAYSDLILFLFLKIETSPCSGQRICAEQLRRVSATRTAWVM